MAEEETRGVCPYCQSVNWQIENVVNTTDMKGIIQCECGDCGQQFEIEVKAVTHGWSVDALEIAMEQRSGENDPIG